MSRIDEERRRYQEERRRYEAARRRYDEAHDRYFNRSWAASDEAIDRVTEERERSHRFDDFNRDEDVRPSLGGVRDRFEHGDLRIRAAMREEDRRRGFRPEDDRYYRDGKYRDDYEELDDRDRFVDPDEHAPRQWRVASERQFSDDSDRRREERATQRR